MFADNRRFAQGRGRMRFGVAISLLGLIVSAGCGSATETSPGGQPFTPCSEAQCVGVLNGAAYEIVMPESWNGTLLLYSHGYRSAQPVPPDFTPVSTVPEPAPGWSSGDQGVGKTLLGLGYALAGSAYASNGWAVADGVRANEELVEYFTSAIGRPKEILAWGDSLGGLITAELAQRHEWVSGALPMCGVLAGVNPNFDLGLELATITRTLLVPELPLTEFDSYEGAMTDFQDAAERILAAADPKVPEDNLRLLLTAALVGAPTQTERQDGRTARSVVNASAEGILAGLAFGTVARQELQTRVGGNPSTTMGVSYLDRLDPQARARLLDLAAELNVTNGPELIDSWLTELDQASRIEADATARTAATALGAPTGDLRQPTLVVHTAADPVVLVENSGVFAERSRDRGTEALLRTVIIEPPATYVGADGADGADDVGNGSSGSGEAPYGAGHCTFTDEQRIGAVTALDTWVQTSKAPSDDELVAFLSPGAVLGPPKRPWPGVISP